MIGDPNESAEKVFVRPAEISSDSISKLCNGAF